MRKDLENTPLLKQVMKALEGKPIDRDNPRQGMKINILHNTMVLDNVFGHQQTLCP